LRDHPDKSHQFAPQEVSAWDIRPDLRITANFTQIQGTAATLDHLGYNAVYVFPAYTANVKDVVSTTTPLILHPGSDNIALLDRKWRQRLTPGWLASWGIMEVGAILLICLDRGSENSHSLEY